MSYATPSNAHANATPSTFTRTARALFSAFVLALFAALPAIAATHTVCASGCDYTSIQAAVNASASGDTLALEPEVFVEGDILVDRDLTIRAASGQATVDGNGANTVIEIAANALVFLEDLKLTSATKAVVINRGIAYLETISVIGDGTTSVYGGIYNDAGGFLVLRAHSVVAGNRSANLGGGISNRGDLEVTNATITGNRGRLGGGILNSEGDVVVGASSISFNHATVRGGGYANANVGGGAVIVLPSASYSGNTAGSACDRYYDIHRTPSCVN